jgi:ribose transport system ATP-binding protein
MPETDQPLLQVQGVTKRFPGVRALHQVDLTICKGEALAVIGENGAGKSTLMKILAGVQLPDEGQVLVDGKPVVIDSVQRALDLGIVLIHQELNLSDNLDVGANIFLGREPRRFGLIDQAKIYADSEKLLEQVTLDCPVDTIVGALPIGQQQMVEIAKALSVNARVLIMDEPTSSLSHREAEALFGVIKDLRSKGVSIIYISHRLSEVKEIADRVTVLRDGENAGKLDKDEINHDNMVRLMVGREISQFYARIPHEPGDVALEVCDLVSPTWPMHKLNLSVRQGEIVGVAGLVGAGRTEMLAALFGVTPALGGEIRVFGKPVQIHSPLQAIRNGMALVPEDRKQQGLLLEMSVLHNMSLVRIRRDRIAGMFIDKKSELRICDEMINRLNVKTPDRWQVAQYLSGGNQQKVVLGKWLNLKPRILLLDEPTRGIDVGAKQEIYQLMEELAEQGVAVLFVSSEMEEILGMSDRAFVMHEGAITGELPRAQLNEEAIMQLATGNVDYIEER